MSCNTAAIHLHLYSNIQLEIPCQRHFRLDIKIIKKRTKTYLKAKAEQQKDGQVILEISFSQKIHL